jgi:formylglycine-generating enzyme required for sulfatase activity
VVWGALAACSVLSVGAPGCSCGVPLGDDDDGEGEGDAGEGEGDASEGEGEGDAGEGEGEGEGDDDTVPVAAGAFTMGCDSCSADEAPARTVTLAAYAIDRTEVTQAAHRACIDAGACTTPPTFDSEAHPNRPITSMTWDDAVTYCAFVGKRLPTEAEWERAARGTDGRTYPWGDDAPDCAHANTAGCSTSDDPLDVGSLPLGASPVGALDMAGNVWEWTADYYAADAYNTQPATDPTGPASGTSRTYRGGGSGNTSDLATTTNRADTYAPDFGGTGLGFRCAR